MHFPPQTLSGQVAIVTGAGRGIGQATAQRLGVLGARVALVARNDAQLMQTRRQIERDGGEAVTIPTDVSSEKAVNALVVQTLGHFGRIDILINNAGIALAGTIESMEPAAFDAVLAGNVRSVYLCCRAVWPFMKAAGRGTIVNVSSMAAYDPFPGLGAYGAAKAFVNLYTKVLAAEGKPHGIRVHAIAPGAVETQMLRGLFPEFPEDQALAPRDVATAIEAMLMPGAAAMSGQTTVVQKNAPG